MDGYWVCVDGYWVLRVVRGYWVRGVCGMGRVQGEGCSSIARRGGPCCGRRGPHVWGACQLFEGCDLFIVFSKVGGDHVDTAQQDAAAVCGVEGHGGHLGEHGGHLGGCRPREMN